jgi:hypothetical protein
MPMANMLSGDTASAMSFERTHKWLNECENTHQHCGTGRNVQLPKRVIDLQPLDDCPRGHGVKLVETEGMTSTYACLSHCWGKDPMPVRTTMETLKEHTRFIPWDSLPKTFQDAAVIARRLEIRYLWIDSLCIVQDSATDWQVESSKMADIYQNALITIAATSSFDFRGGCFTTNSSSDLCLRIEGDVGADALVAVRNCKGEGSMAELGSSRNLFPLFERAWVYQERMLSRRVLYCTRAELQLECRERLVCECDNRHMYPHTMRDPAGGMQQSKREYTEPVKKHHALSQYSAGELCRSWQATVMQYSKLQLTRPSDKLPALSGCAKDIGALTGDRYLAGLWRGTFAEGMLWTVVPPIDQPRPVTWRAPSWSWASVEATYGIQYTYALNTVGRQDFQDRIEAIECVPLGEDDTGGLKSAFVKIKSSLCPAYLRRVCRRCQTARSRVKYTLEHDQWYHTRSPNVRPCTFKVQGLDLSNSQLVFHPDFKYDDRKDFCFFDAESSGACKLAPVFLLHLYDNQSSNSKVITDVFLVLKSILDLPQETFERTAVVDISFGSRVERDSWFAKVFLNKVLEQKSVFIV